MNNTPQDRESSKLVGGWTVLVRAGRIVGRYQGAEAQAAAGCDAKRLDDEGGPVEVFEIGAHQPPPPPLATAVDPAALGWTGRGRLSCR